MIHVAVIGPGLVGSEFLKQLSKVSFPVKLVGIINSSKMLLLEPSVAFDASKWQDHPATIKASLTDFIQSLKSHSNVVLVDTTCSDFVPSHYVGWIREGFHIVTANKKGLTGSLESYKSIMDACKTHSRNFLYESTVGAGLPIIKTLKDLLQTGDSIVKVEGIFSGTLSYIFNLFSTKDSVSNPVSFSAIVKQARDLGYTEPDPRDDLNGLDVGRKVTILARLMGLSTCLDTLEIQNMVPEPLQKTDSVQSFMEKLSSFDKEFDALNQEALKQDQVLRYVGTVDPQGKSSVELKRFPMSHPFASLKGSDNIIAFTTKYFPNPLIIQGAGAGAAVTAFGIMADVLFLANKYQ